MRFENDGTFTKLNSSGTNLFWDLIFTNRSAIELERGTLHFNGNYSSGPASQLTVGIGGSIPGSQFGQLIVGGTAALEGTIAARLASHFLPIHDQVFTVILAGARTGFFANTNIADASSVVYFIPGYGDNYASLTAKLRSAVYIPVEHVGRRLDLEPLVSNSRGLPGSIISSMDPPI